ncbi:MAG TPA: ChbG/HpnK family deacetylase [Candidatus Polarisedimenticolia bacterium]|jgi:predicted glycoside hydrolase/deacetylase ChbG (UPF0249 family)|nr:ChbG/HpnK family deacetylase [Candidatus Polarisedimenticolia bacterium]
MKRLLVVADDLGLTPGVNAGIAAAFRDGILTSASFLTNTAHFEQTVSLIRSLPGLKVGVHLSLVGGKPVRAPSAVPSLAPDGERFRESWRQFLPAWLLGRIKTEEVRAEWEAQIARATAAGVRPAHLDSHQHLHLLPPLWRVAAGLARRFGIPRMRLPRRGQSGGDSGRGMGAGLAGEAGGASGAPLSRRALELVLARLAAVSDKAPAAGKPAETASDLTRCDRLFGIAETGRLDLPALLGVLRRIPEGTSELVTHPGYPDPELRRDYRWGYAWEAEAAALMSPEARQEISRRGIALERT